jgi:hypothetical protein
MSLSKQYATNQDAESSGVPVQFPANADGTIPTFWIARAARSNARYLKALERLTKPHRRALELKTMPPAQAEDIFRQVFVDGNLVRWENVLLSDVLGEPAGDENEKAPMTRDNAIALFTRLPDLYAELQETSNSATKYLTETLEDEAKNSVTF